MAKSEIITAPARNDPGSRSLELETLTEDDFGVCAEFTHDKWPKKGELLAGIIEITYDGVEWQTLTSFNLSGGEQVNKWTGKPMATHEVRAWWPRKYREEGKGQFVPVPQRPLKVRVVYSNAETLETGISLKGL